MTELTEFQARAATIGLRKVLGKRYFSVCEFDDLAKLVGRAHALSGPDYQALKVLHCVDWGDMGEVLATQTRQTCMRILGIDPALITIEPGSPDRITLRSA